MPHFNELSRILNQHFKWNKARMDCFTGMIIALFMKETINLTKLAKAFPCKSKPEASYRRMQRFLSGAHHIDFNSVAKFIMTLFKLTDTRYRLTMDRTNWRWGLIDINFLVLAVVHKGIAIPIYWVLLNKKGNSDTRERCALISRFTKTFGKSQIIQLLADREFIGGKWFEWLKSEGIDFGIRIKKTQKFPTVAENLFKSSTYFAH